MFIRKREWLRLIEERALALARAQALQENLATVLRTNQRLERELADLTRKALAMKRDGFGLGPEHTDEFFGRYSIREEEARQLAETAPPREPRPEARDDLEMFEREVEAAIDGH